MMDIGRTVTPHIPVTTEHARVELRRCKNRTYRTVLGMCRFTVDVAVRPSCLYKSLEEKLNHNYCQTCSYKSRSAAAEAANVQDSWSALQGHSRRRKDRLVQTSSPVHHCSSGPTNSLPPGVRQPETYPPSERPVKHPSRSPRQYTFWNCLHLRLYWGSDNCCKLAKAPPHRPRRLREVLQLTPAPLNLEPPTPPLDTDTARHPNHAPSTGTLATIARFANAPYPWTIPHVAPPGYTYQHQPPHFSFIPASNSTPIPARGIPQTQQPSTHTAPPPTRSPRQCFPAVASDRRSRPPSHPWKILRGSFRSRSTYSQRLPTARTPLRKESANASPSAVSAVINAIRKFSDNDSQDSSSATPNNSTKLSDVPPEND